MRFENIRVTGIRVHLTTNTCTFNWNDVAAGDIQYENVIVDAQITV